MFGKILCWLGIHRREIYNHENLWQIEKCARCSLVFSFEKTTDKPLALVTDRKVFHI